MAQSYSPAIRTKNFELLQQLKRGMVTIFMKIAITGGAGSIGRRIVQAYLDAGHDVLVIDSLIHRTQQVVDPRARLYRVDIRDKIVGTILQEERPDIVSHHVSQQPCVIPGAQVITDADVHIHGLLHVLEGSVNAAVKKFIFASGGNDLYERTTNLPVTEDAPLSPQNAHDISKVAGECYVRYFTRCYGLQHTILRYADVYGANKNMQEPAARASHPIHYLLSMLAQQRSPIIRGTGKEARDHIFIDDVVQANMQALDLGHNQTFNISSGQAYSLNQLFQIIASLLKSSIEPTYLFSFSDAKRDMALDNTRAQRDLQWQPEISLTVGIQCLIEEMGLEGEPSAQSDVMVRQKKDDTEQRALTMV
jgi:UDP-glucose 4-epimerase